MKENTITKREAILADIRRDLSIAETSDEAKRLDAIADGVDLADLTKYQADEAIRDLYRFGENLAPVRDDMCHASQLLSLPRECIFETDRDAIRVSLCEARENVIRGLRAFDRRQVLAHGRLKKLAFGVDVLDSWMDKARDDFDELLVKAARYFPDFADRARSLSAEFGRFVETCNRNADEYNQGPARDLAAIVHKAEELFDALATPGKSDDEEFTEAEISVLELACHLYNEEAFPNTRNKFKDADAIRRQRADQGEPLESQKDVINAIFYFRDHKYQDIMIGPKTKRNPNGRKPSSWVPYFSKWYNKHKPSKA